MALSLNIIHNWCDDIKFFLVKISFSLTHCVVNWVANGNQKTPYTAQRQTDLSFIYTPFLSNALQVKPLTTFSHLMAQMTRTHARMCLFGTHCYCSPHRGSNCPKTPILGGVNRHFPAKCVKYWNVHIIKTTASIITKFCRVIETHKYSLWMVQICPKRIQDGGRPPSWKVEKS